MRTRLSSGGVPDESIDWLDWIGSVGLVQRRIVYRDQIATDEDGNPVGEVTTTQTDRLVSVD